MHFYRIGIIQYVADVITKWALDDAPSGSSRRHNLSIENPNALPRSCYLARLHGDAFLPGLARVSHTRALSYACVTRTFAIFFGRRHVRANIAAYAYLYGIKNHPSLKMHRLLHSRGAESSQRDAEAAKLRDSRTRFTSLFHHRSPKCHFIHKEEQINLSTRISPTILSSS